MEITAKTIHSAMTDLRNGKISPDQFRAVMRQSREQHGDEKHTTLKVQAIAAANR
jgi:hypothetical protein